jgi:hypothetical protein
MEIMGIVFIEQHPTFVAFGFPPVQMNWWRFIDNFTSQITLVGYERLGFKVGYI